ncbi:hypothetical protein HNP84_004258 [Thermocatellispora tengchongensis]|uniref:DUF2218 domain-containing protein n=1 Tax=Thermocatellispora tengchongensis TaxID=1073253 RepID=A0A840P7F7_9ACTN|nr:DUF2218 domain-containing protein [Thermocatellispora tengchongensis]MBB5134526.1 hypothetical protein [Thermocatellispora tengchongensis]
MSHSEAAVSTDRPARYGKQLVAHLGRRHGGEWLDEERRGTIDLGTGRADVSCSPDALLIRLECPAESVAQLEDVVGRHLVRFGARDELVVRWVREGGEPGSEQRT